MKNIVEKIIILLFILVTFNNNAEGLLVIKKSKFTNCNDILYHGDYKGNGEYILYDENQEPYTINCEVEQKIFEQKNYLGLSIEELNKIPEMNLEKIKIYHSEDLYFVFNKKEIGNNRIVFHISEAIESVNTNDVEIGDYIIIMSHPRTSGIITSNSSVAWCSPINGRYNGGCFNGSKGIGDWEIRLF